MSKRSIVVIGVVLALLVACLIVILNVRPQSAEYYLKRGEDYFKEGQFEKAIIEFEKVKALTHANADLYVALGLCYHSSGQYREAIEQYQKAIEIDPEHAGAYVNLGYAYGTLGQAEKEKTYLMKARDLYEAKGDRLNVKKIDKYFEYLNFEKYLDQK
jgi:tetratricopeptide (TPR) repeat protein